MRLLRHLSYKVIDFIDDAYYYLWIDRPDVLAKSTIIFIFIYNIVGCSKEDMCPRVVDVEYDKEEIYNKYTYIFSNGDKYHVDEEHAIDDLCDFNEYYKQ